MRVPRARCQIKTTVTGVCRWGWGSSLGEGTKKYIHCKAIQENSFWTYRIVCSIVLCCCVVHTFLKIHNICVHDICHGQLNELPNTGWLAGWRAGDASLESGYKQHTRRHHQQRAQTTNNSLDVQRKRTRLKQRAYLLQSRNLHNMNINIITQSTAPAVVIAA